MALRSRIKFAIVLLVGIALVAYANASHETKKPEPPLAFLLPPSDIHLFTLGYDEVMADILWIRLLQDFDFCEKVHSTDSSIVRTGPGTEAGTSKAMCEAGWVYHMLDSITELAPRFREAYESGAISLSIIVDDREGARRILDKAVVQFPNDWRLNFLAGYHYLYEIKDVETAAQRMAKAAASGGPPWVAALAGRLYTKAGQADIARKVLEDAFAKTRDPEIAERIKKRLAEIENDASSQK